MGGPQSLRENGEPVRAFGADRSIVGRDVRLNGELYQVTGVPVDFELPAHEVAVLVPFSFAPEQR